MPASTLSPRDHSEQVSRRISSNRLPNLVPWLFAGTIVATLTYFFGFVDLFIRGTYVNGLCSAAEWAWQAWNPEANQEHSRLVPLISAGLAWHHRKKIRLAPKSCAPSGLLFVAVGIGLFLLSARCLQPRFALLSLPFLIYGSVLFVWGKSVARSIRFPCAFLLFMVPIAAMEQATFRLQFIITTAIGHLSQLFGISIRAVGTTLTAADGTFNFAIAEGCSGVRSLTAMTMLTAVYVHLAQKVVWKKLSILGLSIGFAIVGNIGRIFTVVLVAKFVDPDLAAGLYHDYSGFVFFPIAVAAMVAVSNLFNADWKSLYQRYYLSEDQRIRKAEEQRTGGPVSYDY